VFATGVFMSAPADFDPTSGTYNLTTHGSLDIFVSKLTQTSPLRAAGGPAMGANAAHLTAAALQHVVAAAIDRWAAAGLDAARLAGHAADVMGDALAAGTRRTPTAADVTPALSWTTQPAVPMATTAGLKRSLHRC